MKPDEVPVRGYLCEKYGLGDTDVKTASKPECQCPRQHIPLVEAPAHRLAAMREVAEAVVPLIRQAADSLTSYSEGDMITGHSTEATQNQEADFIGRLLAIADALERGDLP